MTNTLDLLRSGQLVGQKELKIAANLTEFPMEILDLADSLELLVLSNNRLSELPEAFSQLKKLKIVFFNQNSFETFPTVLAHCPQLSMISFKSNQLKEIPTGSLSGSLAPNLRWLILTDNQLTALPTEMGGLTRLQKLMLAGNALQALPSEMSHCQNLELIRLSANQLKALPDWLLSLPRLSWLAYAGNPCCPTNAAISAREASLPLVNKTDLQLGDMLGEGASGVIYKGLWVRSENAAIASPPIEIALKCFKGEMTSDGLPSDEIKACIAAGTHPNLVSVLGKLKDAEQAGLLFSLISPEYKSLGGPPDLESCTRDTFAPETTFSLAVVIRIAQGIASAIAHLHRTGITHGDLYAHNILVNPKGDSILGDFGAASFYNADDEAQGNALAHLESRAFGYLLEDLLDRCPTAKLSAQHIKTVEKLRQLQAECLQPIPSQRPLFAKIEKRLNALSADI
jgi:hypothetical protein